MMLIEADRMTNSEDPDQTAPFKEQSDQGLHYLSVLSVLSVLILRFLRYTALYELCILV